MRSLLIMFAVLVSISYNTLADWQTVVVVTSNPSAELIFEYVVSRGVVGGPYTEVTRIAASTQMHFIDIHTPGTGPFGYVTHAENVFGDIGPDSLEGVSVEPLLPTPVPGPSIVIQQIITIGSGQ